jgi:hypothetical protein
LEPEGSLPCSQQPALVHIQSEMQPIQTFPPYFRKTHSNIILPSTNEFLISYAYYMPTHVIVLDFITLIKQVKRRGIILLAAGRPVRRGTKSRFFVLIVGILVRSFKE